MFNAFATQVRLKDEIKERRKLHNAVLDLKGAIRVFCRVRPPLSDRESSVVGCMQLHNSVTITTGRFALCPMRLMA